MESKGPRVFFDRGSIQLFLGIQPYCQRMIGCPTSSWVITLQGTNIAMENGLIEDVFPIENGDIPLLC